MLSTRLTHVTHTFDSYHTHECVILHIDSFSALALQLHARICHVTHANVHLALTNFEYVVWRQSISMAHTRISRATHKNTSCHTWAYLACIAAESTELQKNSVNSVIRMFLGTFMRVTYRSMLQCFAACCSALWWICQMLHVTRMNWSRVHGSITFSSHHTFAAITFSASIRFITDCYHHLKSPPLLVQSSTLYTSMRQSRCLFVYFSISLSLLFALAVTLSLVLSSTSHSLPCWNQLGLCCERKYINTYAYKQIYIRAWKYMCTYICVYISYIPACRRPTPIETIINSNKSL